MINGDYVHHEGLRITVIKPVPGSDVSWDLEFKTNTTNVPLTPGTYAGAERSPFAVPPAPGLEVAGESADPTP